MMKTTRRSFVSAAAGSLAAFPLVHSRGALGANERVVLALIGAGGRGTQVASGFAARSDAEIGFICDLHDGRLAAACKRIGSRQSRRPVALKEIRRVLDRPEVDGVIVATPDHWHALATIQACQAKKHVYVEKPPSHNIFEGRKTVEAAAKYHTIVQVGTQNRSAPYNLAAREYIRSGKLGDIHLVKVFNLKSGGAFHLPANSAPPAGFDWNAWLGTSPVRPYNSAIFSGGWHHYWAYSGGDMADDGVHQLDLAMMLLGDPPMPTAVHASGGRFACDDDQEVPDTQVVAYEFPKMVMTFELTGYPRYMDKIAGDIRTGEEYPYWPQCATRIEIYGSKAMMIVGRHGGGWQVFGKARKQSRPGELIAQLHGRPGDAPHQQNFLGAIRGHGQPTAPINLGHKSASLVHIANIALRVGNQRLIYDPKNETFPGHEAANRLIKRAGREGYRIPDSV
ncbi:MAG: Gfo/Idh/MocA family protein [Isosphaeraceae bacterium]